MNEQKKTATDDKPAKKKFTIIHKRYLFFGFLALLFGITLSRGLYSGKGLYIAITVVAIVALILALCLTKKFKLLIVMLVLFFAGNGLYFADFAMFKGNTYSEACAVVGRVSDDLQKTTSGWECTLDHVYINGQQERNISLLISKSYDEQNFSLKAGEFIAFEGEIYNAKLFNLGTFQLKYHRKNTPYVSNIFADRITKPDIEGYLSYDEVIRLKTRLALHENMSEDNAEICFAVLFGDKSGVDYNFKNIYNEAGIYHILSVSGLHVGFLVALLYFCLKKCNRFVRFGVLFAVLLLYNILCGFAPSVMRASIMAIVLLLAKLSGREYDPLSSLALAGFIIVLFSPLTALDNGFLMSFFSVASIILLAKRLENLFKKFMPVKMAKYIALSISAQIGILPFAATFFSNLNILSVFANLIIVPMFAVIFPILFILVILTLIAPFMGVLLHAVDWGMFLVNMIATFFANTRLKIDLKEFSVIFNILIYLTIFVISYFFMVPKVVKGLVLSIIILASCVTFVVTDAGKFRKNTISYTDYGGKGLIYAVNDLGESLLVCNEFFEEDFEIYAHIRGIKSIDYVLTTNGNFDSDFITKYDIKSVAYPNRIAVNNGYYEISGEQVVALGGYKFNYLYFDGNLAGVQFCVNIYQNFFASESVLSYNNRERLKAFLKMKNNAFNFMNTQSIRLDDCDSVNFYTYRKTYSRYSLGEAGNMQINLNKQKWSLRCID